MILLNILHLMFLINFWDYEKDETPTKETPAKDGEGGYKSLPCGKPCRKGKGKIERCPKGQRCRFAKDRCHMTCEADPRGKLWGTLSIQT